MSQLYSAINLDVLSFLGLSHMIHPEITNRTHSLDLTGGVPEYNLMKGVCYCNMLCSAAPR